ncbi:MAG: GTP cyclohydrolase I FolE [bacterium]|nr:GTP cyclohydrolase I FolE [bacterium]
MKKIENAVRDIIEALGEDPTREGLKDTPKRVAKMYAELCGGYKQKALDVVKVFFQEESYDEIVLVKDIPVYSLCEHHMIPFFGKAHVAYIPRENKITGLSKIGRVVDVFARRLQLQERMTKQVAEAIHEALDPIGVMVVVEAEHFCMTMRGIKKAGSQTVTSSLKGVFMEDPMARAEALALIKS